ncbi:MAG: polyprenyl diphosphate synthase [Candidatus Diapherotrites archaeon]
MEGIFLHSIESIAFIPDGNRRYAEKKGLNLLQSYSLGTQKAWDVLEWLVEYPSIKVGTFYTLSLENFNRSRLELSLLFKVFEKELNNVKERKILSENGIALKFVGRRELFPKKLQEKMSEAEKFTENYGGEKTVNLALGYNGQSEIVDAAKKIAEQFRAGILSLKEINENSFKRFLYSDFREPDLIVRTSGTQRLSGFLTYQSAYSELCFIDKFWPEIEQSDLGKAVNEFGERERRFGK